MQSDRVTRLMPAGIPRYVRCYDDGGKSIDRYTVLFTGNYAGRPRGRVEYLGMSEHPFHPMGVGQHGEGVAWMDRSYRHLGRKIKFTDLPQDCQRAVLRDYRDIWRIPAKMH